ncbi:protein kinase [Acidobacteriota bacterium]
MKCPKCDFENPDTQKFCGECGTQLGKDIPEVTRTIETPAQELTRGTLFADRYEIIEQLGLGGMGAVYRAYDKELKEDVALKLIRPDISSEKKTIERFNSELKLARKIIHKNVGRMYELMEYEGTRFITMEYVTGEDLKSLIRRVKRLDAGTAITIAMQVCEGLEEAHHLGVVHRDLKPSNIMIDKDGKARIMDFGIARSIEAKGITDRGVMIGTPEYLSPEQAETKEVDHRSDIYSLGVILYEMVTGQRPFEGETALSVARKHADEISRDPKEINPQITDELNNAIMKCLEKDKGNRYQNAHELRSELENIEKGIPTTDREVPKRKPLTSKEITVTFGLKKLLVPALIFIAVVIIGLVIWQLLPKGEVVPSEPIKPSIAVLPFEDLSPDKDQEYFCDGLAESIINALTKVKDLRVPARASSFSFKGKERNIQEIGNRLSVNTILEGSVQKAGNRVRITAQLINVDDESHLWSEQYDRDLDDVFSIQDDITLSIIDKLKIELLKDAKERVVKRYTENKEAYDLYLRGKWLLSNKISEEDFRKAVAYFDQAIGMDPDFSIAYVGFAEACELLSNWHFVSTDDVIPKVKRALLQALEIDNDLAEAYSMLGMVKSRYEWDWVGGESDVKRALELNPNYSDAHFWLATIFFSRAQINMSLIPST